MSIFSLRHFFGRRPTPGTRGSCLSQHFFQTRTDADFSHPPKIATLAIMSEAIQVVHDPAAVEAAAGTRRRLVERRWRPACRSSVPSKASIAGRAKMNRPRSGMLGQKPPRAVRCVKGHPRVRTLRSAGNPGPGPSRPATTTIWRARRPDDCPRACATEALWLFHRLPGGEHAERAPAINKATTSCHRAAP
jgi:hypothetical protein